MRYIITFVLVSVFLSKSSFAESVDVHTADSLLRAGALKEASLLYEEIIYNNPDDNDLMFNILLRKTECLKKQGLYDRIEPLLRRIDAGNFSDSAKFVIYYEKALGCYLSENFEKAEQLILPVFNIDISTEQRQASKVLYCLILNEMGRWMEASSLLTNTIVSDTSLTPDEKQKGLAIVDDLYNSKKIPALKSIKKARNLSLLFPGLGQLYNGNPGAATLSFTFVSLSGLYIAYNIINTTYLTAATSGLYFFLYFYFGGANQSNTLVPRKNNEKKSDYNNYLRKSLTMSDNELFKSGK